MRIKGWIAWGLAALVLSACGGGGGGSGIAGPGSGSSGGTGSSSGGGSSSSSGGTSSGGSSSSSGGSSSSSSGGSGAGSSSGGSGSSSGGSSSHGTDVLTYKNDLSRTGQNLTETSLTTANVNASTFGLLRNLSVDGKVDAQPLYVSQLSVAGVLHDTVIAATESDSVYAFDADTGVMLWRVSLLGSAESLSDTRGCSQVTPAIGITSTPVIDRSAGTRGTIYVVAMSKDATSHYHQRLHALDLTTGAELAGSPVDVTATYPANGGASSSFDPGQYEERAALLLSNGVVYTSWTSHCDISPYYGWVIAYSASTLARVAAINLAANSNGAGPAIWMAGSGPSADAAGNIYLLTANGIFDTQLNAGGFPSSGDYGNSFVKLTPGSGSLSVADYFTMYNEVSESNADQDLGSGGSMLLPDLQDSGGTVRHLVVGAGKDGHIYVVNRDSMGKFNSSGNTQIWQDLPGAVAAGVWATPAYFNGTVYYGDQNASLKAFKITSARLSATPQSQSATQFTYPGAAPAVSANGASNGIVWAHENTSPAVLHAYDATNLTHELYNSSQAANNRDQFGTGNKFITPTIADGKVLVGTTNSVAVFGLLH
jgi:hypothetical protein